MEEKIVVNSDEDERDDAANCFWEVFKEKVWRGEELLKDGGIVDVILRSHVVPFGGVARLKYSVKHSFYRLHLRAFIGHVTIAPQS